MPKPVSVRMLGHRVTPDIPTPVSAVIVNRKLNTIYKRRSEITSTYNFPQAFTNAGI